VRLASQELRRDAGTAVAVAATAAVAVDVAMAAAAAGALTPVVAAALMSEAARAGAVLGAALGVAGPAAAAVAVAAALAVSFWVSPAWVAPLALEVSAMGPVLGSLDQRLLLGSRGGTESAEPKPQFWLEYVSGYESRSAIFSSA
jgi:hypothetical protein